MFYRTIKSREIYDLVIAHRGYHKNCPENSLKAYENAINLGLAIELDIRILKDGNIICFHDRNLKRLTGLDKKVKNATYDDVIFLNLTTSIEKVPTLKEALLLINGSVPVLIEIKGFFGKKFRENLKEVIDEYKGIYYFHLKNIIAYFRAKRIWKHRVFLIDNPFRKRFNFIKMR